MRRLLADERVRFLVFGGINTAFGLAVFWGCDLTIGASLDAAGQSILGSICTFLVAHVIAAVFAFWLYRRFVFRVHGHLVRDFLRFELVYLLPTTINLIVLPIVVEAGAPRVPAQVVIAIVMAVINYFGHKYFSFRRSEGGNA